MGTLLHGVHLVDLTTRGDERGSFTETFRQEWFPGAPPIVQSNLSISRAGVLRGLHVHRRQADYWCWLDGTAFVALYDLREGSPTHRQAWTRVFDANESLVGLYIPNGVAHGFTALTDARLQYMVDGYFTGEDEQGFAWNDPRRRSPGRSPTPCCPTVTAKRVRWPRCWLPVGSRSRTDAGYQRIHSTIGADGSPT